MKIRIASFLFAIGVLWYTVQSTWAQHDISNANGSWLSQAQLSNKSERPSMSLADIQPLLKKYTDQWNADKKKPPLWVIGANPGDRLQIPGVTFGDVHDSKAGMELPIRAQLIVINKAMLPESILTTFLHEYGHALYRYTATGEGNSIDSEAEAIRFSLAALDAEKLAYLAYREAEAVKKMSSQEPYKSAVLKLSKDPMWKKYSRLDSRP
jgi:hypothetical protein